MKPTENTIVPTSPTSPTSSNRASAERIDEALCEALEPHPAAVQRLLRNTLETGPSPRRPKLGRWLAGGASLAVAAALVSAILTSGAPSPTPGTPEATATSVLRISNENGSVTVTTPAGSKMIILSGETS